jgi:hypothetical protein
VIREGLGMSRLQQSWRNVNTQIQCCRIEETRRPNGEGRVPRLKRLKRLTWDDALVLDIVRRIEWS